ncbi:MAG TPA: RagB/SusD family nutrient uptake outer membrane protein, partial [Segatella copri]|nr:RagB/SusD family nutrient uptake outer membrane protein [Segatella copri]
MKLHKILIGAFFAFALSSMTTSCVDDWKFGDSFLEKAPGGDVTKDTIFNNAEYTRDFLWKTYSYMYYGLPFYWDGGVQVKMNTGVFETLSDCWHSHNSWDDVNRLYYSGAYKAGDRGKFGYTNEKVWEGVRAAYIFLENVDNTPDMEESEKSRLKAEAKCIIASRYFDMFRHFGGLPIVKNSFSGTEGTYELPRGTVEETVNFMVGLLDEAAPNLPWNLDESEQANWDGRFTKAAAMGLKCKILLFAASPLFNNDQPYAGSASDEANEKHQAWYGNYSAERWTRCLAACQEFFNELGTDGYYQLVQAEGTTSGQYRAAFRKGYSSRGTTEMLLSTRVRFRDDWAWNYLFQDWNGNGGYTPTAEYMEMFDWKDGRPFDLD